MLNKVYETCQYVVENAKHVKINYDKANELIPELLSFDNVHYFTKVPYNIYAMSTKDIINFLLIYDAINFSFWGNPKWMINVNGKELDGCIALLHCIFNLFNGRDSEQVYRELENMTLEDFKKILSGNVDMPLLEERFNILNSIVKKVNKTMNGNFYGYIEGIIVDKDIFKELIENFSNFEDTREYQGETIHFYKLAQLLTSDILHVIEIKEKVKVDYSNLVGCADYKIPQVMQGFGVLEYDKELTKLVENKIQIEENSEYEVEIRGSMIIVIDYIWKKINKSIDRIDINDFIWSKGQDKTKPYNPYHLTRTTSY